MFLRDAHIRHTAMLVAGLLLAACTAAPPAAPSGTPTVTIEPSIVPTGQATEPIAPTDAASLTVSAPPPTGQPSPEGPPSEGDAAALLLSSVPAAIAPYCTASEPDDAGERATVECDLPEEAPAAYVTYELFGSRANLDAHYAIMSQGYAGGQEGPGCEGGGAGAGESEIGRFVCYTTIFQDAGIFWSHDTQLITANAWREVDIEPAPADFQQLHAWWLTAGPVEPGSQPLPSAVPTAESTPTAQPSLGALDPSLSDAGVVAEVTFAGDERGEARNGTYQVIGRAEDGSACTTGYLDPNELTLSAANADAPEGQVSSVAVGISAPATDGTVPDQPARVAIEFVGEFFGSEYSFDTRSTEEPEGSGSASITKAGAHIEVVFSGTTWDDVQLSGRFICDPPG